jgi:hypothetical protein
VDIPADIAAVREAERFSAADQAYLEQAGSQNVGGTIVNFNKAYKDIETITLTPLSTTEQTAIYDFIDIPNPVFFKILLYDSTGTRINGTVSWKARGVV